MFRGNAEQSLVLWPKTGLVKNLSMLAGITISMNEQIYIIQEYLANKIITLESANNMIIHKYVKIFINGNWIGFVKDIIKIHNELRMMRFQGKIEKNVSLVFDFRNNEFHIYTDGGRLIRPYLTVTNNKLNFKPEMLDNITSWEEFMAKYPDVIEILDKEEEQNMMLADFPQRIEKARMIMERKPINDKETIDVINRTNRYDDNVFVRYTHCEIHPCMILGIISSNIPFTDHNQSPRGIFQYNQARQAMGLYISDYRERTDISYILYHPQIPIVAPRASKYTGTHIFPSGENVIVAIQSYTGYNQEDSLLMNNSAIEKGLFRAQALKKYFEQITKNPASSQTGIFMKPDKNKVDNLKDANYDKLSEEGYAKVETIIKDGDVIIGMVKPKAIAKEEEKPYKDNSTIYRSLVPGAIDKVITGLNSDGYPIIKIRVRSERIPKVGDKFSCYDSNTEVLTDKGWIFFKDLTKTHKVATLVNGEDLVYENPSEIQKYHYKGKMYKIETKQINLCVTPNHNMWVASQESIKNYKLLRADQIFTKRFFYQKNVLRYRNEFEEQKFFILPEYDNFPEKKMDMQYWLLFFGIWITEGYIENMMIKIKTNKSHVKKILDVICKLMGFKFMKTDDENIWEISDKQLLNYIKPLDMVDKYLPEWVWNLTTEQCRWLIYGMIFNNGRMEYETFSEKLANDLQRLCLHAGWSANIYTRLFTDTYSKNIYHLTIITKQNNPEVNKNKQMDEWIDYDDDVYCCTVTSGVIYVRRDMIAVFSGNSKAGQKGTIGFKPHRADMPFTESGLIPDIIINPNCMPKRMTIGQLIECLLSKLCAVKGVYGDATPFTGVDIIKINEELIAAGFEPWGNEVMYNGMTGEKMQSKIFIGPTYYQRLKQMVGDKAHCLSMDHEVLTSNGWKYYHQLSLNDDIATLKDGKLIYQKPNKILYYPDYKGDMYHVTSEGLDLMVTTNHRMWVAKHKSSEFNFELAENIIGKYRRYKKDAIWDAEDYQFILPKVIYENKKYYEKNVDMNAWLIFFGIWITEGLMSCDSCCIICKNKQIMDILIQAIIKLEFEYIQEEDRLNIIDVQLCAYMKQFNIKVEKYLPTWVWSLSSSQAKILLDNILLNNEIYCTSSTNLVDDIMRLTLHCGWMCNINDKQKSYNKKWELKIIKSKNVSIFNAMEKVIINISNPVFCLEVTNGIFYVRRNGKAVWTGNSRARGPTQLLTRQATEGRTRDGGLRVGEMERDALCAHGCSQFLKERMVDNADIYTIHVCDICGLFAHKVPKKKYYICQTCKNTTKISKIVIPYAFKLFMQELRSINILGRIRTSKSIITPRS